MGIVKIIYVVVPIFFGGGGVIWAGITLWTSKKTRQAQDHHTAMASVDNHIVNTTFDKYVAFCEPYEDEIHKIIDILGLAGPTEQVIKHTSELFRLRRKFGAWIPEDLSNLLDNFEKKLTSIGTKAKYFNEPYKEKFINIAYSDYAEIMGWSESIDGKSITLSILYYKNIIKMLHKPLDTECSHELRTQISYRARNTLAQSLSI